MKIAIESTSQFVEINGVRCRVWQGTTERGVQMHAFIARIAVDRADDSAEFDRDLQENAQPIIHWPLRMLVD